MTTAITVARPYAQAVFASAKNAAADAGLDAWSQALALLDGVAATPNVRALLSSPILSASHKAEQLIRVLGDAVFERAHSLVRSLATHHRLPLLPAVRQEFEALKWQHQQTLHLELTSAFALDDTARAALQDGLERQFQRKIVMTEATDPSLIGGVVIRTQDVVIDASLRGRLNQLAKRLRASI